MINALSNGKTSSSISDYVAMVCSIPGIACSGSVRVANYLLSGPKSIDELAKATESKPELLDRVLKFLCSYNLFHYQDDLYSLTELSRALCDDDPHSIRDVLCMVDDSWWQAFSQLGTSIKTGKPAFEIQHGDNFSIT